MSNPPPRILICGDVLGRLHHLVKRLHSVNKSTGPFDALLCVGQFFPDSPDLLSDLSDYLEGRAHIPIPTYFTGDYGAGAADALSAAAKFPSNHGFKADGLQLCPNLLWLRGSGRFSLHGLTVVYLSGRSSPDAEGGGKYNRDDVDALRALVEEPGVVDIFMTNEWPIGVANGGDTSDSPAGVTDSAGCDPVVAELVAEIKPRYHIAGSKGIFYAREPYSNTDALHVTRFIGLAAVGNKDKQKFIHAISPTPASTMSAIDIRNKPPNTTISPYVITEKRSHAGEPTKRPSSDDPDIQQYWRYDVSKKRQRQDGTDGKRLCFSFTSSGSCSRGEKCNFRHDEAAIQQYQGNVCFDFLSKGKCERGPDCKFIHEYVEEGDSFPKGRHGSLNTSSSRRTSERRCWFCLSSPDVESHLIITVGESYYCALAKGPLVQDHALLVPIEHHPYTLTMSPEAEIELGAFKNALNIYFKSQGKAVIFFEYLFQNVHHANLQAIPIPVSKAPHAQGIFNLAAKKLGFEFAVIVQGDSSQGRRSLMSEFDGKLSLFYVELPDGTILSHPVDEKETFPIQFGREVLSGLLNMADRADWRSCKTSKEEEIKMAANFKKGFEEFDPSR